MTSEIHSSPAAQWLQGLLAKGAPSQVGNHSNTGSTELPRDSSRISAQAFQLNQAAGASLNVHARSAQSAVSAAHHHRQHHSDDQSRDTSFVSSVAQATVSNLQRTTRIDGPASSNIVGSSVAPSDSRERSFIQERASKVANDLRVAYSQVTAPETASPHNNSGIRPISITA
ncbi:MAG: hypothetical protein ABI945_02040 [Nitrospirales bacterium]